MPTHCDALALDWRRSLSDYSLIWQALCRHFLTEDIALLRSTLQVHRTLEHPHGISVRKKMDVGIPQCCHVSLMAALPHVMT